MSDPLTPLRHRRSVPIAQLGAPAPDGTCLQALLETALRVPDHGKLTPFRLIQLDGAAKLAFGERLVELATVNHPELSSAKLGQERRRYTHAPLVLVVVARIDKGNKVPAIEQHTSAACVAYNLLLGAQAMGYGAQWLTGWAAYDHDVASLLGLAAHEHVVGFVHIGTSRTEVPERERPMLENHLSQWTP